MATQHILPQANYKSLIGTVVNAGERLRTVRVRLPNQTWNARVHKFYDDPKYVLVHDPRRSCDVGDVISLRSNWRVSKHVKHVVTGIVSPFGRTMAQKPPVMTEHERVLERAARRKVKDQRQAAQGREAAIKRLRANEKLARREAVEEEHALNRLRHSRSYDLGAKMQQILVGENDLDLIKHRIREGAIMCSEQTRTWALDDDVLNVATLLLALEHASYKHLYVGKTLAVRAGKPPTSAVIREAELMADSMDRRVFVYRKHFDRLAGSKPGKFALVKTLHGIRQRLKHNWQTRVFETKEPDSSAARQERKDVGKVGADAEAIKRLDESWHAIITAINDSIENRVEMENQHARLQEAAREAATAAVIAAASDNSASAARAFEQAKQKAEAVAQKHTSATESLAALSLEGQVKESIVE